MFSSNVQPKRRIQARPTAWHCGCGEPPGAYRLNDAQLIRCPACGVARPDAPAAVRQRGFVSAAARGDGPLLQRWEDEGGHYSEPLVETGRSERAPAGLSWLEFLLRFFPGRRRHDLEALQAYATYRSEGTPAPSRGIRLPVAVSQKSRKEATS